MRFFVALLILVVTISLAAGTAMAGSPFKRLCLKAMGFTSKTVEKVVYGMVGIILTAVTVAILTQIIK